MGVGKMRTLARGDSISECEKSRDRMIANGWTPITDVKLDDSEASWGKFSYVVVMERPDEPGKKKHKWNNRMSTWR